MKLAVVCLKGLEGDLEPYVPMDVSELLYREGEEAECMAHLYAMTRGIPERAFYRERKQYRVLATQMRDLKMLTACDALLILWDGSRRRPIL